MTQVAGRAFGSGGKSAIRHHIYNDVGIHGPKNCDNISHPSYELMKRSSYNKDTAWDVAIVRRIRTAFCIVIVTFV